MTVSHSYPLADLGGAEPVPPPPPWATDRRTPSLMASDNRRSVAHDGVRRSVAQKEGLSQASGALKGRCVNGRCMRDLDLFLQR